MFSILMMAMGLSACQPAGGPAAVEAFNPTLGPAGLTRLPHSLIKTDTNFISVRDFRILQTQSFVLSISGTSFTLSQAFAGRLNTAVSDGVLGKTEISLLKQNVSASELSFVTKIVSFGSVTLPNLLSPGATLSFIVNANLDLGGAFLKQLFQLASADGVLDKKEIDQLKGAGTADEKSYLDSITVFDVFNNLPLLDQNNQLQRLNVEMFYDDKQLLPGIAAPEWISFIGQGDRLSETTTDNFRCVAGTVVNLVLLLRGKQGFLDLAKSLGLTTVSDLSYKNVHLVQDALYKKAGGGTSGLAISFTSDGKLLGTTEVTAIKLGGLKPLSTLIKRVNGSNKASIEAFFTLNPKGALIPSVNLDSQTGKITFNATPNHAVAITRSNGKYFVSDTGNRNGTGRNHFEPSATDLSAIFSTSNPIVQVTQ
ncbi:MAG: hypothetical protein ACAI44_03840 [Candidatus Sericytochromatia bacterium]